MCDLDKPGRMILEIPEQVLDKIFLREPKNGAIHLKVEHSLPEDAKMLACHYDVGRCMFQLMYESSEWEDKGEGALLDILPAVRFEYIDTSEVNYARRNNSTTDGC